jgi:hypothetical protein
MAYFTVKGKVIPRFKDEKHYFSCKAKREKRSTK